MVQYNFPTVVLFGENSVAEIPKRLNELNLKSCMLVTDSGLISAGLVDFFKFVFEDTSIKINVFSEVHANPLEEDVVNGVNFYKIYNCDCIIALGGGSPMDVAKTVRFMAVHDFPLDQYDDALGGDKLIINPLPPLFAIPTTAGTGSEVGRSSVITLKSTGKKTIFFHPDLTPDIAILDPNFTLGLPPHITSATGVDAFTHCYEAFIVDSFHPMADAIAIKGMELVLENLPLVLKNGNDITARGKMLLSATMGATAFQKGLGMTHSMAHPMSAEFGTHHGLANALCLSACVQQTLEKSKEIPSLDKKLNIIAKLFHSTATAEELPKLIQEFIVSLGIKLGLQYHNISKSNIEKLSELALIDSCHQTHPYTVNKSDFINCFMESFVE
ncbi:MAG: iron-containing alcohol dehydrogenase [Candidatus Marinimicrobia bacterium]|nr:iron-containing alcohol dehydrogenase [Candidatus Neomarinimicrobiota bacterium]